MLVSFRSVYNFFALKLYHVTSLVEPLLPPGVEVWQRACRIFLSCARVRASLQSTPFSSSAFWKLSCHLVRGLPLVLLPSFRASHAMRGYLDSGILTTWPNQRSCTQVICLIILPSTWYSEICYYLVLDVSWLSSVPPWAYRRVWHITERLGRVVSTPASYSGGPELKFRLSWSRLFVVVLSTSRQILGSPLNVPARGEASM
jgi:hypothetical protein